MSERTYTIEWHRVGEEERLTCSGLTPRVLVARLMSAADNNGGVFVHAIAAECQKCGANEFDHIAAICALHPEPEASDDS